MPRDLNEIFTIVTFISINYVRQDKLSKERHALLKLHSPCTQVSVCSISTNIDYALGFLY